MKIQFLWAWLCLLSITAWAGVDRTEVVLRSGAGLKVMTSPGILEDRLYKDMTTNTGWRSVYQHTSVANQFLLEIDHSAKAIPSSDYSCTVILEVKYTYLDPANNSLSLRVENRALVVDYKKNGNYKDRALFRVAPLGGLSVSYKIESVVYSPQTITGANLKLTGSIETERYFLPKLNEYPTIQATGSGGAGTLSFQWNALPWAESYDLEWMYINNYDADGRLQRSPSELTLTPSLFKSNATRVTVKENSYTIPFIYEGGYIVYRVRGIGKNPVDGFRSEVSGLWSDGTDWQGLPTTAYSTLANYPRGKYIAVNPHNEGMNWQQSITYAEEGKSKAVVSYFDGSLRNRQTVTRMNSDQNIIVGETIYDHQGRPAVQILPVPVQNAGIIDYQINFNRNTQGNPFSRTDFDINLTTTGCLSLPAALDSTSGASRYYSTLNPNLTGINQYIPRAYGYPYTQTIYTNDNTGRIKYQSGVGRYHKIGSTHETKYLYGSPTQTELDRLFGSDVGYATEYKKNVVIDPNGQVSVSYLNGEGKVIATALAGDLPDNVQAITSFSQGQRNISSNLLYKTQPTDTKGAEETVDKFTMEKSLSKQFTVTSPQTQTFDYSYTGNRFNSQCTTVGIANCYDCVVDISILVKDKCGKDYLVGLNPTSPIGTDGITIGQNFLTALRSGETGSGINCGSTPLTFAKNSWSTSEPLQVGEYTITKVLRLNEEALNLYAADYVKNNRCIRQFTEFARATRAQADTVGCELTCGTCLTRLGSFDRYDVNVNPNCSPCYTQDQYQLKYDECKQLCDTKTQRCKTAYDGMVADMAPFGQYGEILSNATFNPTKFPLSIYNETNALTEKKRNGQGNWRKPFNPDSVNGNKMYRYLDITGQIAYIEVTTLPGGNYRPAILSNVTPMTRNGRLYIYPEQLATVSDFVQRYWKDSYAKSLVYYHPEYENLAFCLATAESDDFDREWSQIKTVTSAFTTYGEQYILPIGTTKTNGVDPYFNSTKNRLLEDEEYRAMQRSFLQYTTIPDPSSTADPCTFPTKTYSIWDAAYAMVKCPNYTGSGECQPNCIDYLTSNNYIPTNLTSFPSSLAALFNQPADTALWPRFKNLYIGLKTKIKEESFINYSLKHRAYNACIGDTAYDPRKDDNLSTNVFKAGLLTYGMLGDNRQPCGSDNYAYYRNKKPRFPTATNNLKSDASDAQLCYETDYDPTTPLSAGLASVDGASMKREPVDCAAKTETLIEDFKDKAEAGYYQECGQCPVVKDLEGFLKALAVDINKPLGKSTPVNLVMQCPDETLGQANTYSSFSSALKSSLGFQASPNKVTLVINNLTSNTKILSFQQESTVSSSINTININKTIILKLKQTYNLTEDFTRRTITTSLGFNQIQDICCVRYTSQPSIDLWGNVSDQGSGNYFKATAQVVTSYNQYNQPVYSKFIVEGKIDMNLIGCPAPITCQKYDGTNDVLALFRLMTKTISSSVIDKKSNQSLGTDAIFLSQSARTLDANHPMYGEIINNLNAYYIYPAQLGALNTAAGKNFNEPAAWSWKVYPPTLNAQLDIQLNGQLQAFVKDNPSTVVSSFIFEFSYKPSQFPCNATFANIISFSGLRPVKSDISQTPLPKGRYHNAYNYTLFATVRYADSQGKPQAKGVKIKLTTNLPLYGCAPVLFNYPRNP